GRNIAAKSMELAAEKLMEEHPDTDIVVNDPGQSDLDERLTIGMGSGGSGLPDVSMVQSYDLPDYVEQFPDQFLDIGEMGFDEHIDKFVEFKSALAYNGEGNIIAAPWDVGPAGVFYRVDMFEESNVDPDEIETWDDYLDAGKKIKDAIGVDMIPVQITQEDNLYRPMINQLGISYYNENGEINIAADESHQVMEFIKKMYD